MYQLRGEGEERQGRGKGKGREGKLEQALNRAADWGCQLSGNEIRDADGDRDAVVVEGVGVWGGGIPLPNRLGLVWALGDRCELPQRGPGLFVCALCCPQIGL